MRSTGKVRRIDELNRIAIPKVICDEVHIKTGDPLEMFIDKDKIILQRYQPGNHLTFEEIKPAWQEMTENERDDFVQLLREHFYD